MAPRILRPKARRPCILLALPEGRLRSRLALALVGHGFLVLAPTTAARAREFTVSRRCEAVVWGCDGWSGPDFAAFGAGALPLVLVGRRPDAIVAALVDSRPGVRFLPAAIATGLVVACVRALLREAAAGGPHPQSQSSAAPSAPARR